MRSIQVSVPLPIKLKCNQAVLAIRKNGHGAYQSVTVFVPYDPRPESASKFSTIFGDLDIVYSWRSTYIMLDDKGSGLHTGTPRKSEQFFILKRSKAIKIAESLYANRGKQFLGKCYPFRKKAA